MQKFDRPHTIQTGLWPRRSNAIRSFSTQIAHSSYHTNDRKRHSKRKTESIIEHGGRPNPSRIPSTSVEIKTQSLARSTHQEENIQGRISSINV
jgi:hypothetical protein